MKRIFAAVRIEAGEKLAAACAAMQKRWQGEAIRWVPLRNLHLTLKFFGETPEDQIPAITGALERACAGQQPIELSLARPGIFGSRYHPRVIWLGTEDGGALQTLFLRISQELEAIGIHGDRQNFVPHLTLGRITRLTDGKAFGEWVAALPAEPMQASLISELILYESILKKEGPEYHVLHTFPWGTPR